MAILPALRCISPGLLLSISAFTFLLVQLKINVSASMPLGIYLAVPGKIQHGDVVSFCLGRNEQAYGLMRGYLIPGKRCGQSMPLVKQVIAIPSDVIHLEDQSIIIHQQAFSLVTSQHDAQGRLLHAFRFQNNFRLHGYVLWGTNKNDSWDSRYFGPVPKELIITRLKPVFLVRS